MALKNISPSAAPSLDNVCYLCDDDAQALCFCAELPVQSSEYFRAGQSGIKASKVLAIDSEEYNGETRVIYDEIRYVIYRTYLRQDGLTELYLTRKAGD